MFKAILVYFNENDLIWFNLCIGMCIDGTATLTRKFNGLVTQIKQIAHKDIFTIHYFICN